MNRRTRGKEKQVIWLVVTTSSSSRGFERWGPTPQQSVVHDAPHGNIQVIGKETRIATAEDYASRLEAPSRCAQLDHLPAAEQLCLREDEQVVAEEQRPPAPPAASASRELMCAISDDPV